MIDNKIILSKMFLGINGRSPGPQIEVKILKLISTLQLYHITLNYKFNF